MDNPNKCRIPRGFPRRAVLLLAAILGTAFFTAERTLFAGSVPAEAAEAPQPPDDSAEKTENAERQKQIAALVAQLGDKDYFVRQKAQEELAALGFEAYEALAAAAANDDLEIAARAKYLLKLMRVEWAAASDPPEVKRLLKGYELLDAANREERIHALAALPDGKAAPALCRLARYEKSGLLSKRAALDLLQSTPGGAPPAREIENLLPKNLERGARPAMQWIGAWLRMARDPQAAVDEFERLIDAETRTLKRAPDETAPELVAALMRFQIAQLKRLGKNDAVVRAMQRLIELQTDDAGAIAELAEWFLDQKAWGPFDDLAKKFAPRFDSEPIPLYLHAAAKLAQHDVQKAEELAAKARKLNPGKDVLPQHYLVAQYLQKKGFIPWAIEEFEILIARSGDQDYLAFQTVCVLAELYHDQGKNLEAGKTIEKFVKKPSVRRLFAPGPVVDLPLEQVRSEMYYYYGCHWESQGDRKQRRENMERALKEDPANINAMIGYYRLPDLTPAEKRNVVQLIEKSAAETRESIRNARTNLDDPRQIQYADAKEATDCNQFAWLIANTEGNFDEALKYAKRAVELLPASGGIRDTLAHVYFAKGDYENAVKTQENALELEPHSAMIEKKLKEFIKARDEKK
ncbi:MAG: hypothetical protein IT426_07045 [Pirellulales bacterium]|nr:hypothetical protein [Pirellulales bacterium]